MGGAYVLPWLPIHRHQLHYRQYLTRVLAPFALAYDFRQFLFRPQMDLFDSANLEASDAPLWPELPERARSVLTELMARMILAHAAAAVPLPAKEDGDDL